jgi:glyoxylase-like metal-dependent hydrolase (beta-lactamase superfamily II)
MKVEKLVVGEMQANCYLVWDEQSKEAVVIDPGGDPDTIFDVISQNSLKVIHIINTHAHVDHVGANDLIRQKTQATLFIHSAEVSLLQDLELNLSHALGREKDFLPPTGVLNDKDKLKLKGFDLEVLHTPGHTPGSICLYVDGRLFSGDTLFAGGVGRTDLPGGNFRQLKDSLEHKILKLSDEVVVYPGHGPNTTIGKEKRDNSFLGS